MNRFFSLFCKIFLKPIVDIFLIKEVKGLENVPKGNFILAANHQSHLDQICTGYVCVPRRFTYIGQVDRYSGFEAILRDFIYFVFGVIPVNRNDSDSRKKATEEAVKRLKRGDILVIYPEGTRTRTGEIQKAYPGVAKLFLSTGLPILPVGIKGTFELMPSGKALPKIKKIVEINIGAPLYFKEEFEEGKKLNCDSEKYKGLLETITEKIMEKIKNLCQ
jgi:1-acyl-sn-glycerol-3-phosphate acyltransferase